MNEEKLMLAFDFGGAVDVVRVVVGGDNLSNVFLIVLNNGYFPSSQNFPLKSSKSFVQMNAPYYTGINSFN